MTKVLFSNFPFWEKVGDEPLRRGVRAGSRWPMTIQAEYAPDNFRFGVYLPAPIFMASAAGWLKNSAPELEVTLRDSIARGESYASYGEWLEGYAPDWIVLETATSSWDHDRRALGHIKKLLPQVQFIIAGTIAVDPERSAEAASLDGVAAVVKGEYEKGCVRVIVGGERGVIAHDFLSEAEMNGPLARWPLWDEGAAKHYYDANPKGTKPLQLQMWASRGCVYKCQFCAWPAGMTNNDPDGSHKRIMRFYSEDYIYDYILERQRVLGTLGCVYFDGDSENMGDKQTKAIARAMARLRIPFSMMCRADTCSEEAWKALKDAGCFGVKIGFESGSQRVIDQVVNKRLNLKKAAETARWLRSIGIAVHGTFMIGLPGEKPEESEETKAFIETLYRTGALDTHQLSGTATLSGTPLANLKVGETNKVYPGMVKDETWQDSPDGQRKIEKITREIQLVK